MADAAVDGERPPQPPAEDAEHADDVPGAEAPFDFAAMRPAGALAKVARHEMFAQPPNKCQLGCCKLNSDFSENNAKWTGKEELGENRRERTGLELEQVQLTEQRLFYRRILMDLTPLEAKTMTTFGGNDLSASILYPQISVGAQLMQRIDYAGFVGASKEQLDTLRMGATKIHPRTLPTLQPGHGRGPHKYNHVNFNIAHLKKECFGGQQQKHETNEFENEGARNENRLFERCCNAYLIFYERVTEIEAKTDMLLSEAEEIKKEAQQRQIFQKIHEQNQAFKHLKIFSENDFIKFMLEYVNLCTFQDVLYFP